MGYSNRAHEEFRAFTPTGQARAFGEQNRRVNNADAFHGRNQRISPALDCERVPGFEYDIIDVVVPRDPEGAFEHAQREAFIVADVDYPPARNRDFHW